MGAPRGGARVFSRGGGKARHTGVGPPAPPTSVSARRRPRAAKDAVAAGATADIDDAPPAGPTTHLRFGGLGGAGQDEAEAVASAGAGAPRVPLTGALAASLCVDRRKLKATAASYTHVDDLTTLSSLAVVDLSNNALTDISGLAGCVNLGHVNVVSGSSFILAARGALGPPSAPVLAFLAASPVCFSFCIYPTFRLLTDFSGALCFIFLWHCLLPLT